MGSSARMIITPMTKLPPEFQTVPLMPIPHDESQITSMAAAKLLPASPSNEIGELQSSPPEQADILTTLWLQLFSSADARHRNRPHCPAVCPAGQPLELDLDREVTHSGGNTI